MNSSFSGEKHSGVLPQKVGPSSDLVPTIWLTTFSALIEYSIDLRIPEGIWEHPSLKAISEAALDLMTWPNVWF